MLGERMRVPLFVSLLAQRSNAAHIYVMSKIDFSHLSQQERLDLIGELWDSLDPVPPTPAQEAEIGRRLATLDQDIEKGRDAAEVLADLRRRRG
jgi:putative addiction module component (TIGR02574 family)